MVAERRGVAAVVAGGGDQARDAGAPLGGPLRLGRVPPAAAHLWPARAAATDARLPKCRLEPDRRLPIQSHHRVGANRRAHLTATLASNLEVIVIVIILLKSNRFSRCMQFQILIALYLHK